MVMSFLYIFCCLGKRHRQEGWLSHSLGPVPLFNALVSSLQQLKEAGHLFLFERGGNKLRHSKPRVLGLRVTRRAYLQSLGLHISTSFNLTKMPLTAFDGDQLMLGGPPPSHLETWAFGLSLSCGWLFLLVVIKHLLHAKQVWEVRSQAQPPSSRSRQFIQEIEQQFFKKNRGKV